MSRTDELADLINKLSSVWEQLDTLDIQDKVIEDAVIEAREFVSLAKHRAIVILLESSPSTWEDLAAEDRAALARGLIKGDL